MTAHVDQAHHAECFMRSCLEHPAPSWVCPVIMVAIVLVAVLPGLIIVLRGRAHGC